MGIFSKRKARKDAEARNEAGKSAVQPTRTTNTRGYKQSGFSAGEGTGSHSSGPNKSGNDNYVSPQLTKSKEPTAKKSTFKPKTQEELKSTEVKSNTKSVAKDAKLPTHIEKTQKKSAFDKEDEMYQRGVDKKNAEAKKKAAADAKKKAAADAKKKAAADKLAKGSKKTNVVNKDATNRSGYKTHYTQAQLQSKQNDYAKQNRSNRNEAIRNGDNTYMMVNPDGTKKKVGLGKPPKKK
jgi:hypothetical protein